MQEKSLPISIYSKIIFLIFDFNIIPKKILQRGIDDIYGQFRGILMCFSYDAIVTWTKAKHLRMNECKEKYLLCYKLSGKIKMWAERNK